MSRSSHTAIERDRVSARSRYHRTRDHARKVQKAYKEERYENRPFIGWDSEGYDYFICHADGTVEKGPQRTMLFGCSVPGKYVTGIAVSSKEMLDLILQVESEFPESFHVGFSFDYDVNQILQDLPWRLLAVLKILGTVKWKGFRISHVPHKIFSVSKDGVSVTIYDCFGYFHSKYTHALDKYKVGSAEKLRIIAEGKSRRGTFTYAELPEVITYWEAEISLLPELMEHIRTAAYGGGFRIGAWHGPGALANYALRYNGAREYMSRNVPGYAKAAIRLAYAGGRFQAWQCGEYNGDIYTLDKNSAYVQAISILPNLAKGRWERQDASKIHGPDDIARFGLYHIIFDDHIPQRQREWRARGIPERPYPLFHRDKNGRLTWPDRVDGWYWSPEARIVAGIPQARFAESIVFCDDGTFPFRWVSDSYDTRVHLQDMGNPAEKAYKWALAAIYGAFARRVGWDRKTRQAPRSHELAWAGYITSHCRAAIFDVAQYAYKKGGLISVDTDGVTSTVPFPESLVPEGFGKGLGQWKQEHFSSLLYWQNGIYWLRDEDGKTWKEAKSRGVPKGVISITHAQEALANASFVPPYKPAKIVTTRTRYIGYRQALGGRQFNRWRKWEHEPNEITFGGAGKGTHIPPFCHECRTQAGGLHTITHIPPKQLISVEHRLPWLQAEPDDMTVGEIEQELGSDIFGTTDDIFKDQDLEDRL